MFILIIIGFQCRSPYDKYLRESCIDCKFQRSKLYTINGADTFYYNKKYYGHVYNDGTLIYERDEKIVYKIEYLNGGKNGMYTLYFKSGNLMEEGTYKNNMKNGVLLTYYDSTNICIKTINVFSNDTLIREFINEDSNCGFFNTKK